MKSHQKYLVITMAGLISSIMKRKVLKSKLKTIKSLQKKKSKLKKIKTVIPLIWMKKSLFLENQLFLLLLIQNNHLWVSLLSLLMSVCRVHSLMILTMKINKSNLKFKGKNLINSSKMILVKIIKNTINQKIK